MRVFLVAMAVSLSSPAIAFAQAGAASPPADCRDDNGVDRCAEAQQARTRALFAAATIEQLHMEGAQLLRAFFVNGYGQDEPLVAFVRPRGGDPEVIVTLPGAVSTGRAALRTVVPLATWDRLLARARFFDRELVPLPRAEDGIPICLHSWVVTIEAAGPAGMRRKTSDACGDAMAADLGFEMADAAVELLPACALLDAKQHRNAVLGWARARS